MRTDTAPVAYWHNDSMVQMEGEQHVVQMEGEREMNKSDKTDDELYKRQSGVRKLEEPRSQHSALVAELWWDFTPDLTTVWQNSLQDTE